MGCRDLHPTGRDSPSGRVCPLGFASFSLRFDRTFRGQCQAVTLGSQPQLTRITGTVGSVWLMRAAYPHMWQSVGIGDVTLRIGPRGDG